MMRLCMSRIPYVGIEADLMSLNPCSIAVRVSGCAVLTVLCVCLRFIGAWWDAHCRTGVSNVVSGCVRV